MGSNQHRSAAALVRALLLVFALVAGACGGGGDDDGASGADAPAAASTSESESATTRAPGATQTPGEADPQPVLFTVGEEVWHSGFRIEVVEGSVIPDVDRFSSEVDYTLVMDLRVENLGSESAFFGPTVIILATTGTYEWDAGFSQNADVPGGLTGNVELSLRVDEGFDPSTATIIFGDADGNRAQAPLGDGGDEAIRREPINLDLAGEINLELVDIVVTDAELRYDVVERHSQVESGKRALTLRFDVISRSSGNWSVFADNLALVRPDGTAVAPDGADLPNIPGSDDGVTTEGLYARFLVDEDPAGSYTLRFSPGSWFVGDDGVDEGTLEFELG